MRVCERNSISTATNLAEAYSPVFDLLAYEQRTCLSNSRHMTEHND